MSKVANVWDSEAIKYVDLKASETFEEFLLRLQKNVLQGNFPLGLVISNDNDIVDILASPGVTIVNVDIHDETIHYFESC